MATAYFLGIDVGTSRTAAATARSAPDTTLDTRSFPLGRSTDSAPSSVFVTADGLLFGDAAERRGISQPERLVREFKVDVDKKMGSNTRSAGRTALHWAAAMGQQASVEALLDVGATIDALEAEVAALREGRGCSACTRR